MGSSWFWLVCEEDEAASPGCCWGLAWALDTRTLCCDGNTRYKAQVSLEEFVSECLRWDRWGNYSGDQGKP